MNKISKFLFFFFVSFFLLSCRLVLIVDTGGSLVSASEVKRLRSDGLVNYPADIGVDTVRATGDLLAARSLSEVVEWSGGLYTVPMSLQ